MKRNNYLNLGLPLAAIFLSFTGIAQATPPPTSPYILNGSSTPNDAVVTASGNNDVVTTTSGTFNPSSAFSDSGSNTSVTIGSGTSLTVTTSTPSNGAITITSGTITNSGSIYTTGLLSAVVGLTSSSTITNSTTGVIDSNVLAIAIVNGGTIINSGSITGVAGVYATTSSAYVTNNAGGIITGTGFGNGLEIEAGGIVTNSGTITGGGDGVYVKTDTATVTNNTGALIYGGSHGLELTLGGTVVNSGTISSNQDGIFAHTGITTVTNNAGGIISNSSYGNGLDLEGGAVVTNSGSITGIYVNNGPGTVTNNSTGTITSLYKSGIELGGGGTVTNSGDISGDAGGILIHGLGTVTNLAGGIIDNTSSYNFAVSLLNGGTVTNSGSIGTADASNFGVFITGTTGTVTNNAGGTIRGIQSGINLNNGGDVYNYGTVIGDNQAGLRVYQGNVTNYASGVINGHFAGVQIDGSGGTFTNYGTVASQTQYGVRGATTVNNYGTITSLENQAETGNAAYNAVFINSGTYFSQGGTLNAPNLYYALQFSGSNNTATIDTLSRFNGATARDMFGGGASNEVLNFDFLGGATPVVTGSPVYGSVTVGDYTYTYQGFTNVNITSTSYTSLGTTPNEVAIGAALDNAVGGNFSTPPSALMTLQNALTAIYNNNPADVSTALSQLSPEKFAVFNSQTAFSNASFDTQALDSYLSSLRGADGDFLASTGDINSSGLAITDPSYDSSLANVRNRLVAWNPGSVSDGLLCDSANSVLSGVDMKDTKSMAAPAYDNPWNFFVRGSVILAQGASQTDVPYFSDNTESVVLGTDYRINPNFLVGVSAGYAHTNATLDHDGSTTTVDSYSPGIYASYADHGWYANFGGEYIYNTYQQSRAIAFLGQMAQSSPDGDEGVVNLDGGYDFHHGAMTFGPIAGLQYTHLTVNSYSETGSAADLNVGQDDSNSLRSRLGGTFSYAFKCHGTAITPHIDASWQHEFLDQSRGVNSQFGFGGGSFAVSTPNPSRDSALVDAGVTADLNRTVSVFVDYIVQAGQDNYFGQSAQAGVKIGF
jgi:uncharacterized protein YhjY with autotransporter beta-barrel domain